MEPQFIVLALILTCFGSYSQYFLSEPHLKEKQFKENDLLTMRGGLWASQGNIHSGSMSLSNWYRKYKVGKTRAVLTSAGHPSLPNPTLTFSLSLCLSYLQLYPKDAITTYKVSGTMVCLRRWSIAHILERSTNPEYSLHLIQTNKTSYLFFLFCSSIIHFLHLSLCTYRRHTSYWALTCAQEIEWWSREARSSRLYFSEWSR